MNSSSDEKALLDEQNRINYRLRSTFFYRKLKEYNTVAFPALIRELYSVENLYSWDARSEWGIGEDAFINIKKSSGFHLIQVFCHPEVLREHHRFVAYYRNLAALSQKSVGYLLGMSIDLKKIEADTKNDLSLSEQQAKNLAHLFNEHITLIIDSSINSITKEELYGILLASTGAQIDGSWRNAIGAEAEKAVQRLLVKAVKERDQLAALLPNTGQSVELYDSEKIEAQIGNIDLYRGVKLKNRTTILFSSEPDISLLDENGSTICVLEVKGGSDPAGALERYGAAKKSFEEARVNSSKVKTILVASCITPEVRIRIKKDPLIFSYYNLTSLLSENSKDLEVFLREIFSSLGIHTS